MRTKKKNKKKPKFCVCRLFQVSLLLFFFIIIIPLVLCGWIDRSIQFGHTHTHVQTAQLFFLFYSLILVNSNTINCKQFTH